MATNVREFRDPAAQFRLEPLGARVLVQRDPERTATKGGIQIAENAVEKPLKGVILSVGLDVKRLHIGERVVFGRFSGLDLPDDLEFGKDLVMLKEDEILGREWDLAVATV